MMAQTGRINRSWGRMIGSWGRMDRLVRLNDDRKPDKRANSSRKAVRRNQLGQNDGSNGENKSGLEQNDGQSLSDSSFG
ncbi:hypothetical protein [Peribacillus psychrosaccharolyticus]|nr:hypothetical protein [Peribacillus psychrosaccharolyticus]